MSDINRLRVIPAVAACKASRTLLRISGKGGTAVPGKIARRICPDVLKACSDGMEIVIVTGTNGKSTSCRMIEHAIAACGHDCLYDKSGANLLSGITANLTCNTSWLGKPKTHYAVLECDEAVLKHVVGLVHPKAIVVTNLFSDQVDRLGGVEKTLEELKKAVKLAPYSSLVLNADEPVTASLAIDFPGRVIYYGMEKEVGPQGKIDTKDAGKCPVCGGPYSYSYHTYAHLGGYSCPKCGYGRKSPDIAVLSIDASTPSGSSSKMRIGKKVYPVRIAIPAVYNISNAAAALGAAMALGLDMYTALNSLSTVTSAFGRQESFDINGNLLQMILVKNPAGCNQAFSYLKSLKNDYTAVLCLNNRTGDGHDISWIEDTDYEMLASDEHMKKVYLAGECKDALLARLKKAGVPASAIKSVDDYEQLLKMLMKEKRPIYALPNYTSMMELRKVLAQATGKEQFWE